MLGRMSCLQFTLYIVCSLLVAYGLLHARYYSLLYILLEIVASQRTFCVSLCTNGLYRVFRLVLCTSRRTIPEIFEMGVTKCMYDGGSTKNEYMDLGANADSNGSDPLVLAKLVSDPARRCRIVVPSIRMIVARADGDKVTLTDGVLPDSYGDKCADQTVDRSGR